MSHEYKPSLVVNIIAGPCAGKSVLVCDIFSGLKKRGIDAEICTELAKSKVYLGQFDFFKNQLNISKCQEEIIYSINGKVEVIVNDGSLLNGLAYNEISEESLEDKIEAEKFIITNYNKYKNLNIFIDRGNIQYVTSGRLQKNIQEAIDVDNTLLMKMNQYNIPYTTYLNNIQTDNVKAIENLNKLLDLIVEHL